MRISFANASHPERLAKKMKKLLSARGHQILLSQCREALARSCGYRSWNDLLAHCTGEAEYVDAQSWLVAAVPLMARELMLDPQSLREDLSRIAPLLSPVLARPDWKQRRDTIAANLATISTRVEPFEEDGFHGFRAWLKSRHIPKWLPSNALEEISLALNDEGSIRFSSSFEKLEFDGRAISIRLGQLLKEHVRRSNKVDRNVESTDAYAVVHGVLKRFDEEAMERLRNTYVFQIEEYDAVRRLHFGESFQALVQRLPHLRTIAEAVSRSRTSDKDGTQLLWSRIMPEREAVEEMMAGKRGDAMTALIDIVEDHVTTYIPWATTDRATIASTIERVGAGGYDGVNSLTPRRLAALSFVPLHMMSEVGCGYTGVVHMVEFVVKNRFFVDARLDPRLVFEDIDKEFAGESRECLQAVHAADKSMEWLPNMLAGCIVDRLVEEVELKEPLGANSFECADFLRKKLLPCIAEGKGVFATLDALNWKRATSALGGTPWQRMHLGEVLPQRMRGRSAIEICRMVGTSADEVLGQKNVYHRLPRERLLEVKVFTMREGENGDLRTYSTMWGTYDRQEFAL